MAFSDSWSDSGQFARNSAQASASLSVEKCELWLQQKSLLDPPSNPAGSKSNFPLVAYTPSASSTSTWKSRLREERTPQQSSPISGIVFGTNKGLKDLNVKRLGYRNPPRQIDLITGSKARASKLVSAADKENVNPAGRRSSRKKPDLSQCKGPAPRTPASSSSNPVNLKQHPEVLIPSKVRQNPGQGKLNNCQQAVQPGSRRSSRIQTLSAREGCGSTTSQAATGSDALVQDPNASVSSLTPLSLPPPLVPSQSSDASDQVNNSVKTSSKIRSSSRLRSGPHRTHAGPADSGTINQASKDQTSQKSDPDRTLQKQLLATPPCLHDVSDQNTNSVQTSRSNTDMPRRGSGSGPHTPPKGSPTTSSSFSFTFEKDPQVLLSSDQPNENLDRASPDTPRSLSPLSVHNDKDTKKTARRKSLRKRNVGLNMYMLNNSSESLQSLFEDGASISVQSFIVDSPDGSRWSSEDSVIGEPINGRSHSAKKRNLELAEMDDDDDERHGVPQKKMRKKKNKGTREERSMKKYLRNTGQEYKRNNPKAKTPICPARKRKSPHTCRKHNCQDVISDEVGESIFHEYWEQGSYEKRVAYVSHRVEIAPVKVKRPKLPAGHIKSHPKEVSHKYCFHINGEAKQVCKQTFLDTLGETDGFLRFAVRKKRQSVSGVVSNDKRGKHSPRHKLKPAVIDEVKTHILRFPSYKSHYKRSEVGDTRYLPSHLDIQQMYDLYISEGHTFVSYSSYDRIFNTLGRTFKKPHTDTCQKCDEWHQMLKEEQDFAKREEIEKLHNAHLDRAQAAYDLKKKLKKDTETDPSLRVLVFDLEQVLETPLLTTGLAFYLRQLNTYNLTIYDCSTKITHCYMWCEVDGNRGANEVASCLFMHILEVVPETVKKIVFFSDSTTGQNRNSFLAAMFLTVLQMHASLKSIEHVFLEVGHTRMEVDSKHSVIERKKSHADNIVLPSDWYNLVRELGAPSDLYPSGRFAVTEMKGEFYDFHALLKGPLVLRTRTTLKEKFNWMKTPLLRYDANQPGKVFFKRSHEDKGYECLDFQRRGKAGAYNAENLSRHLKRCHRHPLPISAEKKEDILKLLPFIPTSAHAFYNSIATHGGDDDFYFVDDDLSGESDDDDDE